MTCEASRISASSCASLIARQPAETGVPLVIVIVGAAFDTPSLNTNRTVSSMPRTPELMPRSLSPWPMRW